MGSNVPTVSDAELDVLKVLWQRGASTHSTQTPDCRMSLPGVH